MDKAGFVLILSPSRGALQAKLHKKIDSKSRVGTVDAPPRKYKVLGWDLDEYRRVGVAEAMRERDRINNKSRRGQNDIKKLRRENEQLRREIWSLRDEYDKLEEILKKQKSREESDEPEGRSEIEAAGSECSEDEEDDEEEEDEDDDDEEGSEFDDDDDAANDQEVRQENAENQKISSEKPSVTPTQHRTLTVVHEEEEPKKDQPHVATVAVEPQPVTQPPPFPYHSTSFEQPYPITTTSFGSPFAFPPPAPQPLHVSYSNAGATQPTTTQPQVHRQPTTRTWSFEAGAFEHPRPATPPPPPGWQGGLSPRGGPPNFDCPSAVVKPPEEFRAPSGTEPGQKGLAERRRAFFEHYSQAGGPRDNGLAADTDAPDAARPRHFFAPLPAKCKSACSGQAIGPMGDAATNGGGAPSDNGDSPSSEKTGSTAISRGRRGEGSLDDANDSRRVGTLLGNGRSRLSAEQSAELHSCNGPTKSLSCQDLNSRLSFAENLGSRNEQLAKSDGTLDSASIEAFKSQLSVTLRQPGSRESPSPDAPEIPKLPCIDYKLFNNPLLQNFEQAYQNFPVRTEGQSPLSLHVCESPVSGAGYSSPVRTQPSFASPSEPEYAACKRGDLERLRLAIASSGGKIFDGGERREYQATSFESPSPRSVQVPPMTPYEPEAPRRMPTGTTALSGQQATCRLYRNVPFTPGARHGAPARTCATTQTSPDDRPRGPVARAAAEATEQPSERRSRKDKGGPAGEKAAPAKRRSPSASRRGGQRALKRQTSVASSSKDIAEAARGRDSEANDGHNESRSSSSGQESPKKSSCEPATSKRVSLYFSARKRPSLASSRTSRSRSVENASRHVEGGGGGGASERERTNSISSREAARADKQQRRTSTSSGSVPWCACWGNGCI